MKIKVQTAKLCVFCNRTGVTKEHIWSDWMKAILLPVSEHHQTGILINSNLQTKIATVQPVLGPTRQGAMTQRKIRNICRVCNGGWMSQLVDRAKPFAAPLIQDHTCELSSTAQRDLAGWIAMAAIMGEFTDVKTAVIPAIDRETVKATGAPPLTWTIYLGRYAGTEYAPSRYRHDGMRLKGSGVEYPIHVTTYVLGALLIHAFSATDINLAQELRRDFTPTGMTCVWPLAGKDISWPVSPHLSDADVNTIHDAIMLTQLNRPSPA